MRTECGFDRAWPWWDETLDAGQFAQSDMFSSSYFGNLPAPVNGNPVCVTTGAFAGLTCNIGPGDSNTPHCLSRGVDESLTGQCNSGFVNLCNSRTSYADMESCSEGG
jgi:tyrosinase